MVLLNQESKEIGQEIKERGLEIMLVVETIMMAAIIIEEINLHSVVKGINLVENDIANFFCASTILLPHRKNYLRKKYLSKNKRTNLFFKS
jgi:hypothetical protein